MAGSRRRLVHFSPRTFANAAFRFDATSPNTAETPSNTLANFESPAVSRFPAKGPTQKDLADRLGLERTIYTKIETGDRRIDVIETVKICRILGLKLEDLVEE